MACWNIVSISLLSEKEGNQDEIKRSFERWREHEERWRVSRREREEKESVEERDCDNKESTRLLSFCLHKEREGNILIVVDSYLTI